MDLHREAGLKNDTLLRALACQPTEYTPAWLMRQAGRYLPEYRAVRERLSLLDLCKTPEAAAEVTVLAVDPPGGDAGVTLPGTLPPAGLHGGGLGFVRGARAGPR